MLSEQSKRNVELAFHRAAKSRLIRNADDSCIIELAREPEREKLGGTFLAITISSFVFRLMTVFRVAEDAATCAYYGLGTGKQRLEDGFSEVANLCCGAISHELSYNFTHLAMSAPDILKSPCFAFLTELKPDYLSSFAITINDSVHLRATLCMCCSAPMDIAAINARKIENEPVGGELEMF